MPYTTPPTFADAAILTATQLNTLSDDIEFLYGLTTGVNIPFRSEFSGTEVTENEFMWQIRHLGRYLHFLFDIDSGGTHDRLRVYYNSTIVYEDDTNRTGPYTWSTYVDLNDTGVITPTPTLGNFYLVSFAFTWSVESIVNCRYILESDSTTL